VVLLSSPRLVMPALPARRIVGFALALPLIALALSPLIALVIHRQGVPNYGAHYRLVAQAVEKAWGETTEKPLKIVGSYNNLLYGVLFYLPERPSTFEIVSPYLTPWTTEAQIARDGIALVCPADEALCMKTLDQRATGDHAGRRIEVAVSRSYLGTADTADRFVIVTIPPTE